MIPPHYGIVDGVAFYVKPAIVGDQELAVRTRISLLPVYFEYNDMSCMTRVLEATSSERDSLEPMPC